MGWWGWRCLVGGGLISGLVGAEVFGGWWFN